MASPRITKTMREGIVKNTMEHTFKKEALALAKREAELANKAYRYAYKPAEIKAMKALGDKFINSSCIISVNANGKRVNLAFGGALSSVPYHYQGGNTLRELGKGKDVNEFQAHGCPIVAIDSAITNEVDRLISDQTDLYEKSQRAAIQLMATLESVQSFKKLRAVWPQGEKFYDMYDVDSETKSGVPAVVITELNTLLGLK